MEDDKRNIKKVIAYITRFNENKQELLVNIHKDYPDAGTVKDSEEIEKALFREIKEESGIVNLILKKKIKQYIYYDTIKNEYHERHVFHLEIKDEIIKNNWIHIVDSDDEDKGLVFCYYWESLKELPKLTANQDDYIGDLI
jgi:8-oxo-dGTP pyrophosphatase MutT (NUDIX family)